MSEFATTISAILKQKTGTIASTTPDASVYHAIEAMAERKVGALLVMREGELIGIISERDYARKVILQGRSSKETSVADIMSSPVITVSPHHTVGECMRIITDNHFRHLPVVSGRGGGGDGLDWRPGELGDLGAGEDDSASGGLYLRCIRVYPPPGGVSRISFVLFYLFVLCL